MRIYYNDIIIPSEEPKKVSIAFQEIVSELRIEI